MKKQILLGVAAALILGAVAGPAAVGGAPEVGMEAVVGLGVASALGCIACGGGAVSIALSGWGAVFAALFTPGSLAVGAACVGLCAQAMGL